MARTTIKELDSRVELVKKLLQEKKRKWEIIEIIQAEFNVSKASVYDYIKRATSDK